ncbi:DUF4142 domain-containing protein [Pontibacter ruber]|uniref:DUF4142 domain-containing protein n=1 Tax=Pontibacter ruber TaxID=1343895 RepID=A0ABW5CU42_9BACT|nr:DUF4142 domain-containing protein [Pontibacter ruber]
MKKLWIASCCFLSALAFTACDNKSSEANEEQSSTEVTTEDTTGTAVAAPTDTTLTEDKKELMTFAANAGMLQMELGKLAVEKGSSDQVRQYGQRMVDIYTTRQKELQELAKQYRVTLPQTMENDQMERVQELRDTDPEKFDKAYWDTVVDAHQEAVKEYDDKLKDVKEATASGFTLWARNNLKEMRAQMEEAMRFRLDMRNRT